MREVHGEHNAVLATRIIPTLLTRGRTLVKGVAFESWRVAGVAAQAVRIHSMRGVDELIMLDISATKEGRGPDLKLVEELSETCFMPITVGGGIKTLQDAKDLLRAGADKVSVCSAARTRPELIAEIANSIGSQAIVVAIDYHTGEQVLDLAVHTEQMGAGEILLTCMDREGRLNGYDLDTIKRVSEAVSIPVIAHGGAGTYAHMLAAVKAGASAVAAGAMYQWTDQTPRGAAEYLAKKGLETRI